jgi:hypothetical protein
MTQLIPDLARHLHRDAQEIGTQISRLRCAGINDALVIFAPSRGGQLAGSTFLGYAVIEADIDRCLVGLAPRDPA